MRIRRYYEKGSGVAKEIKWGDLYLDKCMENEDLKNEIRILQDILRVYLPIIEVSGEGNRGNK